MSERIILASGLMLLLGVLMPNVEAQNFTNFDDTVVLNNSWQLNNLVYRSVEDGNKLRVEDESVIKRTMSPMLKENLYEKTNTQQIGALIAPVGKRMGKIQDIVTGRVIDSETDEPLPGVNIAVKGTTRGTTTDSNGEYELVVESLEDILVYTFIGYQTQEVNIRGRTNIDIALNVLTLSGGELVVTAQGIQREERALGYAVSNVSSKDIESIPTSDVTRRLQGKIPGVDITSSGGMVGSATNFVIRGTSTITGNSQPLFIVDGVRFNSETNSTEDFISGGSLTTSSRFLDIDPDNIEDISVLKGLAAATIYGEEGKNGVVLITTKSGSFQEKSGFDITLKQTMFVNEIASLPHFQSTYGNGGDQYYAAFFSNWGTAFDDKYMFSNYYPNLVGFDEDGYPIFPHPYSQFSSSSLQDQMSDFIGETYSYRPNARIKDLFQKGGASSTNIDISGSVQDVNLNLSVSRSDEKGFTPSDKMTRNNISLGLNFKPTQRLSISSTSNLALTSLKSPPVSANSGGGSAGGGGSFYGTVLITPLSIAINDWPWERPDDKGSVYYRAGNDVQNPLWTLYNIKRTEDVSRYFGKIDLSYQVSDWLLVNYKLGLDTYSQSQEYLRNRGGVQNSSLVGGYMSTQDINYQGWNHNLLLNYNKMLNDDFYLMGVLGGQINIDKTRRNGLSSVNQIVFDLFRHSNFETTSSSDLLSNSSYQFTSRREAVGLFMTAELNYKEWVYLNLSGRNDWLSELEPENRKIFYPSFSMSVLPLDIFQVENSILNYLKLRGGVGTSAGAPRPYTTRGILSVDSRAFLDNSGIVTTNYSNSTLGNANLKPERLIEMEFGVETRLLNDRVGLDFTMYNRKTRDLITSALLDPSTGYTNTMMNVGEIQNNGVELAINFVPVLQNSLSWNIGLNFTRARSEVKSLGSSLDQVHIAGYANGPANYAIVGQPMNIIKGTVIKRDADGHRLVNSVGDYITADQQDIIGDPNPDYNLSLFNTLNYKNFSLNIQFDYQHGGDMYSVTISNLVGRGATTDTEFDRNLPVILPGYKEDGTPNDIQTSAYKAHFNNIQVGPDENQVYDVTHFRLSNVSLSYQLPRTLLSKIAIKDVMFSLTASNLWYFLPNTPQGVNFDPNVHGTSVGSGRGLEFMTSPTARQYGGSIRIQF